MRFRKWTALRRLRVFGAPIYVHWSVFAAVLVLASLSIDSPIDAAVAVASYIAIIVIHEFGHAYVARRRGCEVLSIRIAFLHGQCEHEATGCEWDEAAIAWGGVLAQLLIAVPILTLAAVFNRSNFGYADPAIVFLGYLNLVMALLNLAPVAPLDGATAWRIIPLLRYKRSSRSAKERAQRRWKSK